MPEPISNALPPSPTPTSTAFPTPTPTSTAIAVNGTLTVHFLDVGQGDAILLQETNYKVLIDAGRHDHEDVVPYLEKIGIDYIEVLVGTHPHADHIGQFPQVLDRYRVDEVWMSGDQSTTQVYENAIDAMIAHGDEPFTLYAGEAYQLGSMLLEIVSPDQYTGDINNGSLVIRVVFGNVAFLFTGDAEEPSEQAMIASGRNLHAQILKLGHHGSDTSSSPAFLEAVQPEVAIWSAGADNEFGHPSASVIDRLTKMGVIVMGTATHSTIVICTDGIAYFFGECQTGTYPPAAPTTETATPTPGPTSTHTPAPMSGCAPGQININTATVEELDAIIHIGASRALALLQLRPFVSVDDMERIDGISANRVQDIKIQGLACVE